MQKGIVFSTNGLHFCVMHVMHDCVSLNVHSLPCCAARLLQLERFASLVHASSLSCWFGKQLALLVFSTWQQSASFESHQCLHTPEFVQAICENSNQPLVVQLVDSGTSNISIRAQDFTALAPAYLGSIPVSVQQVYSQQCC